MQLAFGAAREEAPKSRLGHLRKAGVGPLGHLCEFRGDPASFAGEGDALELGRELRVDAVFERGQTVKVAGVSKGKGFQGTIKRHNFHRGPVTHGSHNVRAPGSIGASADPARVFKGIRGPGQMGNKRVTQRGLEVVDVRADENLLLVRGSVPGPRERGRNQGRRLMPAPQAPLHRRQEGQAGARRGDLRRALPRPAGARDGACRAGLPPARHGVDEDAGEVAMTGAKAWRQKGTGRARAGALSVPYRTGGGVAFGPRPRATG